MPILYREENCQIQWQQDVKNCQTSSLPSVIISPKLKYFATVATLLTQGQDRRKTCQNSFAYNSKSHSGKSLHLLKKQPKLLKIRLTCKTQIKVDSKYTLGYIPTKM